VQHTGRQPPRLNFKSLTRDIAPKAICEGEGVIITSNRTTKALRAVVVASIGDNLTLHVEPETEQEHSTQHRGSPITQHGGLLLQALKLLNRIQAATIRTVTTKEPVYLLQLPAKRVDKLAAAIEKVLEGTNHNEQTNQT